ncbi:hypothetical protein [Streptomyces sp. NBC_01320]|nr:hypothetical protein OG395_31245 [Streptomyces sp. NBC_01320]
MRSVPGGRNPSRPEQWRGHGWVTTGRNRLLIDAPDTLKRQRAGT